MRLAGHQSPPEKFDHNPSTQCRSLHGGVEVARGAARVLPGTGRARSACPQVFAVGSASPRSRRRSLRWGAPPDADCGRVRDLPFCGLRSLAKVAHPAPSWTSVPLGGGLRVVPVCWRRYSHVSPPQVFVGAPRSFGVRGGTPRNGAATHGHLHGGHGSALGHPCTRCLGRFALSRPR